MKKILIIEDDQVTSAILATRLKAHGYLVTQAWDAIGGVEAALKLQPDVVLLDISMPAGDGFLVAQRIQRLLPVQTPLIFLTASRKPELRRDALELGAAAFFVKPVDIDDLLAALQLALARLPAEEAPKVYAI